MNGSDMSVTSSASRLTSYHLSGAMRSMILASACMFGRQRYDIADIDRKSDRLAFHHRRRLRHVRDDAHLRRARRRQVAAVVRAEEGAARNGRLPERSDRLATFSRPPEMFRANAKRRCLTGGRRARREALFWQDDLAKRRLDE